MSDELHPTRLWWCAEKGRGVARHDDVQVRLRQRPPVLPHARTVAEIDYLPGMHCFVQETTGPRRDMAADEVAECLAFLRAVAAGTHELTRNWRPT